MSISGRNDFVKEPVAGLVSEQKKGWCGYHGEPEPWYEACQITALDGEDDKTPEDAWARVKVRGNWTTDYPKKIPAYQFG